jgi:hypothetical protein
MESLQQHTATVRAVRNTGARFQNCGTKVREKWYAMKEGKKQEKKGRMECKWRRGKASLNDRNKRSKQEGKKRKSWKELTRVLSLHSLTISVAVALFNCGKLRTLISLVTLPWLLWLENVSNYETHCCTCVRWTVTRKLCGYHGYTTQLFMFPRWLMQVLHPPQKFERPPFWNAWWYRIRKCVVEVTFNDMTSLLNFIRIYWLVQILLCGDTDRQTAWWSR